MKCSVKEQLMEEVQCFEDIAPACRRLIERYLDSTWKFSFAPYITATLGKCWKSHRIELSYNFARGCFSTDRERVIDTILHEFAHALAWTSSGYREEGWNHGRIWKKWCRHLGIPDETPRTLLRETPSTMFKYMLVHKDTREVFGRFRFRPRLDFSNAHVCGREGETRGKLVVVRKS